MLVPPQSENYIQPHTHTENNVSAWKHKLEAGIGTLILFLATVSTPTLLYYFLYFLQCF